MPGMSLVGGSTIGPSNPYESPRQRRPQPEVTDTDPDSTTCPKRKHNTHDGKPDMTKKGSSQSNKSRESGNDTHMDKERTKSKSHPKSGGEGSQRARSATGQQSSANEKKSGKHRGQNKSGGRERNTKCDGNNKDSQRVADKDKHKKRSSAVVKSEHGNKNGDCTGKGDRQSGKNRKGQADGERHDADSESNTDSHHSEGQESKDSERESKGGTSKVVRTLSRAVRKKLENYLNEESRENLFQPDGIHRTTKAMHGYDLAYRLHEITEGERQERRQAGKKSEGGAGVITPRLKDTPQRVVLQAEARRLTQFANTVFDEVPIEKLSVIHRYRPHSRGVASTAENGHVHNYSRAEGGVLNTAHYVDFYTKEGLHSGNPEINTRLKKMAKKNEEKNADNNDGNQNKKEGKQNTKGEQSKKQASQKNNHSARKPEKATQNGKSRKSRPSSQWSVTDSISRDEEGSRAHSRASDGQHNGSYADDFEEDDDNNSYIVSSHDNISTGNQSDRKSSAARSQSREGSQPRDDYSDDFDEESRHGSSQFNSKISLRSRDKDHGDTSSIRTYVSVEHAVEVKQDIEY